MTVEAPVNGGQKPAKLTKTRPRGYSASNVASGYPITGSRTDANDGNLDAILASSLPGSATSMLSTSITSSTGGSTSLLSQQLGVQTNRSSRPSSASKTRARRPKEGETSSSSRLTSPLSKAKTSEKNVGKDGTFKVTSSGMLSPLNDKFTQADPFAHIGKDGNLPIHDGTESGFAQTLQVRLEQAKAINPYDFSDTYVEPSHLTERFEDASSTLRNSNFETPEDDERNMAGITEPSTVGNNFVNSPERRTQRGESRTFDSPALSLGFSVGAPDKSGVSFASTDVGWNFRPSQQQSLSNSITKSSLHRGTTHTGSEVSHPGRVHKASWNTAGGIRSSGRNVSSHSLEDDVANDSLSELNSSSLDVNSTNGAGKMGKKIGSRRRDANNGNVSGGSLLSGASSLASEIFTTSYKVHQLYIPGTSLTPSLTMNSHGEGGIISSSSVLSSKSANVASLAHRSRTSTHKGTNRVNNSNSSSRRNSKIIRSSSLTPSEFSNLKNGEGENYDAEDDADAEFGMDNEYIENDAMVNHEENSSLMERYLLRFGKSKSPMKSYSKGKDVARLDYEEQEGTSGTQSETDPRTACQTPNASATTLPEPESSPLLNKRGKLDSLTNDDEEYMYPYGDEDTGIQDRYEKPMNAGMKGRHGNNAPYRNASMESEDELSPLLETVDQEKGEMDHRRHVPTSTFVQSVFNSANVLIGLGVLSLSYIMMQAGLVVGTLILAVFSLITIYTAKVLARCLDIDPSMMTYSDIGKRAFGSVGEVMILAVFISELLGAAVAFFVLVGDTFKIIIPTMPLWQLKCVAFLIMTPTTLLRDMSLLAYTSFLGIGSIFLLMLTVISDGLAAPHTYPGSLHAIESGNIHVGPQYMMSLPITMSLVLASFAGHAVFPNIYRDMKKPKQYGNMLIVSYLITFLFYMGMAYAGYLMFGLFCADEITKNINSPDYFASLPPFYQVLTRMALWMIAINPLTKFSLTLQPVFSFMEAKTGGFGQTYWYLPRIALSFAIMLVSIVFPGFDRVMSLMGAMCSFTVSVSFPCACSLKLFGNKLPLKIRILEYFLVFLGVIMALVGTIWSFLPDSALKAF